MEESNTGENKRSIGTEKEQLAKEYLLAQGYQVLEMNYRCRMGEVDIVAKDKEYLCFVEVKYRTGNQVGSPQHAVDARKQRRICRVADFYLLQHKLGYNTSVRFDVVAITGATIALYKNAFYYKEI
ncbi:MAG: YraN family protein [Lachnospiraceae bacterium]|nr:YraN family protein [Lachnospiraceae bacterium]